MQASDREGLVFARKKSFRHKLFKKKSLLIGLASTILVAALAVAFLRSGNPFVNEGHRAVIVDQLNNWYPNPTFRFTADSIFHESNWTMYYSGGWSGNVTFYRSLPQQKFNIIILRAHTALNPQTGTLAIFTSEMWNDDRASTTYLTDLINGRLASVRVTENATTYFGITPNFVKAMNGDFENAVIIIMGCDSLNNTKMAEAFLEKGAKVYIGWTGPVSANHTDAATQQFLKHLVGEKKTVKAAITETIDEVGEDPVYRSSISFYPQEAGEFKPET